MASVRCDKRSSYLLVPLLLSVHLVVCASDISAKDVDESDNHSRPGVEILQGKIRGVNMVSRHGRNFFGFMGIPFAQPPVGDLRFRGPLLPGGWEGTLDASINSSPCAQPQVFGGMDYGDEDCLYLNVYTPRLPTGNDSSLLPVMLYFHGGAFKAGSNDPKRFGPKFLLDKDVVLVVPNYRLGLFGFLSTGDEVAPGNWGLKDMVRALEWNRDNIRYFGGDPDRVTIFGESAGAMSVHLLTLTNLTNGLFQKFITESGSALTYDTNRPRMLFANRTIRLGEHFGCPTNTSTDLVNCLRGLNTSQLLNTDSVFRVWNDSPGIIWSPTIEPDMEGAILTDSPANLLNAGKVQSLPWLSSLNKDEGIVLTGRFFERPDLFENFLDQIDFALPAMLTYGTSVDDVAAYTEALKSYYLNDLTANRTLLLNNLTQLVGDAIFAYPAYSANQKHLIHATSSQYFCSFQYQGTFSFSYLYSGGSTKIRGVAHSEQVMYLFPQLSYELGPSGLEMNEADWKIVDTMVQLWTSFAITGTPSTEGLNTTTNWEPYSSRKSYLRIGNNSDPSISVGHNYLEDRMQFWEKLTAATSWK